MTDLRYPPSPGQPAPPDPTPTPPLNGEGRGEVGAARNERDERPGTHRASASPLQGEGLGVEESHAKRRPPDWRASPRAKKLAPKLRRAATEAEKELWWHLRRKLPLEGTHFRRQVPIGPFVVDFCCHGRRLIVELDGGQHSEDSNAARDARRDRYLEAHGYRVLRFWNAQVFTEIDVVIETIWAALAGQVVPTPTPPLEGEGRNDAPP